MQKKAFTLIELVIGIVLIGVWLSSIIQVLQYATRVTNTTKAQVVAVNLAREGVETVFTIRDSNRKMFSSKKDQCWLSRTPNYTGANCETFPWLNSIEAYYSIKSPLQWVIYFTGEQILVPRSGPLQVVENKGNDSTVATGYKMCFYSSTGWTSWYWDTCSWAPNEQSDTRYGKYRRWIEIKWLFLKDNVAWGTQLPLCTNGSIPGCGWPEAKELRFCSKVDYFFSIPRRIELCSAITNFEE